MAAVKPQDAHDAINNVTRYVSVHALMRAGVCNTRGKSIELADVEKTSLLIVWDHRGSSPPVGQSLASMPISVLAFGK